MIYLNAATYTWGTLLTVRVRNAFTIMLHSTEGHLEAVTGLGDGECAKLQTEDCTTWEVTRTGEHLTFRTTRFHEPRQVRIRRADVTGALANAEDFS